MQTKVQHNFRESGAKGWWHRAFNRSGDPIPTRAKQIAFSIADQGLAVGGMFLVNIALARTQSKEQYGIFALSYSIFTFLQGLHNAAILEAYTVYGSGRHNKYFAAFADKFARVNFLLCVALTTVLALIWRALSWKWASLASPITLGLALACGFLLTAAFIRRTFYIRRRPDLAARFSLVFFLMCSLFLWLSIRLEILSGFVAFAIAALAWIVAGFSLVKELPKGSESLRFVDVEPAYWAQHWKYSRWVLATAFVFQFTWQGYYWLSAAFLSVKQVADLRAMYNLVTPVDQIFIAMSFLVLPRMSHRHATDQMNGLVPAWKAYVSGVTLITLGFAALVNLLGPRVMHVLYAGKFDDIAPLLGTLAFMPVVMGIGNTMNDALKSAEKPNLVFYAYLCSGSATFLVGIPLVIRFGLRGAVYGMLATAATYTLALGVGLIGNLRDRSARPPRSLSVPDVLPVPEPATVPSVHLDLPNRLAPIALFVYNRPEHTRRTMESLQANDLASQSDLIVFSDGPKSVSAESSVRSVREYVRAIDGFRSINVVEREKNLGLAASVIAGVSQLCSEYGRIIVVEDDLLTSPDFLAFMNVALDRYQNEPRVFSVSGFNFAVAPNNGYSYDAFYSYRSSSWGWGTWKDRWEKADWSVSDYSNFRIDQDQRRLFNRGGQDLSGMLDLNMAGKLDSWAIRWAYAHYKHNSLALLSTHSRVYNIGFDGSGVHCKGGAPRQGWFSGPNRSVLHLPKTVEVDRYIIEEIQRACRPSTSRVLARNFRDKLLEVSEYFRRERSPRVSVIKN